MHQCVGVTWLPAWMPGPLVRVQAAHSGWPSWSVFLEVAAPALSHQLSWSIDLTAPISWMDTSLMVSVRSAQLYVPAKVTLRFRSKSCQTSNSDLFWSEMCDCPRGRSIHVSIYSMLRTMTFPLLACYSLWLMWCNIVYIIYTVYYISTYFLMVLCE